MLITQKDCNLIGDILQLLNLNCESDLNDDQFLGHRILNYFLKFFECISLQALSWQTFLYFFRYLHNHLHKFHMDPEINDFTLGPSNNPAEFRLRSKLETDVLTCEFCGFSSKTRANHNVHLSTCKQNIFIIIYVSCLRKSGKLHCSRFCQLWFNKFWFAHDRNLKRMSKIFFINSVSIWRKSGKPRQASICQLRFNEFWTKLRGILTCFFLSR